MILLADPEFWIRLAGIILINVMGARQRYSRRRDLYW